MALATLVTKQAIAMQHTYPLLLLLAAAMASGLATSSVIIDSTCAAAANSGLHTPYDYCVRMLSADLTAASASDARGVAIAAANLTVANVVSMVHVLTDLIESLQECLRLYREMNGWIIDAINNLHAERVDEAWPALKNASFQPAWCELALMEGNSPPKNPVSDENNASTWLSTMASDITQALHNHRTPTLKK